MRSPLWVLFACTIAASVEAQTADEILDSMAESYAAQISGIDDYIVHGTNFTSYYTKTEGPNGYPVFRVRTEDTFSGMTIGNMTSRFGADNLLELRERMSGIAEYVGRTDVAGVDAHVLRLTDFSAMDSMGPGDQQPPDSVLFFVDPDRWVLVRMSIHGSMSTDGRSGKISPQIDFEDYRNIEGLWVPFRTRATMVGAEMNFSEAQIDDARQSLERLEQRLQSIPQAQRDMMMDRLRPQLERMQEMVESGALVAVFQVESVEVNTGVTDGL